MNIEMQIKPSSSKWGGGIGQPLRIEQKERNCGIDALRIFSMFLIVILHILGHGGILKNATGTNKYIVWCLEVCAYCAVDVYALISGYVGYTDKPKTFKSQKILMIWVQVFCYSFGITLSSYLIKPESIGINTLINSIFPIVTKQYWYASSYFALLLLLPWINQFIRSFDINKLTYCVGALFCVFSILPTFGAKLSVADPFSLDGGNSTLWLMVLYIIGAWLKRVDIVTKINARYVLPGLIVCFGVTCFGKGILDMGYLVSYISPTILLISLMYVVLFSKMRVGNQVKKVISFFAPATFGVYLIHDNSIIRKEFISQYFGWIADSSIWLICIEVIGSATVVLLVCLLIEKMRLFLFDILRINLLLSVLGRKLDNILIRISNWLGKIMCLDL